MSLANRSDEELLADCQRANGAARDAAIDELFSRHYERVARWCLRFTGEREAAADLAQDVFIKAQRHLASFKGSARFTTWLYAIARNEWLNKRQRAGPPMRDEEAMATLAAADAWPDELTIRGDQARRLQTFLTSTLDPTERTVFTLHYGDDMPLEAITRLLRLDNPSGAKAYIVSARRKLTKAKERLRARGEEV
jgi:RNA polymerase sigma-70 factor (ECF subfamily)